MNGTCIQHHFLCQVTGQKDTIHNIFLSKYPVEIVSTFCADSAHWRFYNNKRLIKHALFIPTVNSNVLAKQISSLVNSRDVTIHQTSDISQ